MTDHDVAQLIEKYRPPLHVRRHCAAVANFAVALGQKMLASGEKVDLTLLRHAAVLHDLVRVVDFREFNPEKFPDRAKPEDVSLWQNLRKKYAGLHHAEACARILEENGFNDVAQIVSKHGFLQILNGFDSWEEKLLYYADKRTRHETVVSLKERLLDGRRRNAPETVGLAESKALDRKVFDLEQEIFRKIGDSI